MKRIIFVLALILSLSQIAWAQSTSVPPLINYQGRLTDANGNGLNGTKKLEFNIYDHCCPVNFFMMAINVCFI